MNPLKLRMPKQGQGHLDAQQPRPSELYEWLKTQPAANLQSTAPLLLDLLQKYNRRLMPPEARLKALTLLKPAIDKVLKLLREKYQDKSLPLTEKARGHSDMCLQFLDELSYGYKITVTQMITEKIDHDTNANIFVVTLYSAIDQLGQLLLENYSQYRPLLKGLWGELHRLYLLAEQNNVHNQVLPSDENKSNPFATIQHAYLRLALLALTQPNHLMPGQTATIYEYLEKWTAGCRLIKKTDTAAEAGDIVIDLADERPPAIATGYARFRPVNGRFLDIIKLRAKLEEISNSIEKKQSARVHDVTLNISERLQRDLLIRLNDTWRGRAERENERKEDGVNQISMCVGLDAAHYFTNGEQDYNPERDELYIHRPQQRKEDEGLSLLAINETPWDLDPSASKTSDGLDQTRLSRFEVETDVWETTHDSNLHVRDKREATWAHFQMGPWLRMNQSPGGMSLKRLPESQSKVRVGSLVAYLDHGSTKIWKIGILRWLQDSQDKSFNVGLMILAQSGIPVAVRAIGGAGAGGEYFRSLLVRSVLSDAKTATLLVPASIYDIGTQLVLNLQTELKYLRLTKMIETTSSFSLFEYKQISVPPAEQVKIDALGHEEEQTT
jgi:hypothetical protein